MGRYDHERRRRRPGRPPGKGRGGIILTAVAATSIGIAGYALDGNEHDDGASATTEAVAIAPRLPLGSTAAPHTDDRSSSSHKSTSGYPNATKSEHFERCGAERFSCVVDGDTIWLEGVKIRLADIDTPEISRPSCERERALGESAAERLRELLNAGPFDIATSGDRDEDRYGRKLRIIIRDGQSLGEKLVAEGLANRWSGKKEPWC